MFLGHYPLVISDTPGAGCVSLGVSLLLRERYPGARVAFLAGSAATGAVTSTSDLDIFVLLGDEGGDLSYVETTTHQAWLVEAFVYTPVAAEH